MIGVDEQHTEIVNTNRMYYDKILVKIENKKNAKH